MDELDGQAVTNPVKFNKGKCQIVCLGWGNPGWTGRLGNEMLESRTLQRDLGIMVDAKLERVRTALAARGHIPVLRGTRTSSQSGQGGIVALCSALGQPHLKC